MSNWFSRWKRPLVRTKLVAGLRKYPGYIADMWKYSKMDGAEPIRLADTYPCLFDRTAKSSVDSHYFYQHIWAMKRIYDLKPELHVDVGSSVDFVGLLSVITNVHFIDIRPLVISPLENLEARKGSILNMPYPDNSLESVSCLHVTEHIGLGRYGDTLDPHGTKKAVRELARCLARRGSLLLSLPVGKPRLCFNAHRIHSPRQIIEFLSDLRLVEFSGSGDDKNFVQNISIEKLENARYACGMFWFRKE